MSRAIGVDLGASHIKVAEIDFGGRVPKIAGLFEMPRPAEADLGPALQAFFASQGLKGERVALGLGDGPVFLRTFQFPFSDRKRVLPAVQGEFEDELPVELENYILDIRLLGRSGRNHEFLAGLAPATKVAARQNQFEASGILASSIFADVEALAQLALHQCLPAAHVSVPYAVCDIGAASTKLAVLRGGDPQALNKMASPCATPPEILSLRQFSRGFRDVIGWIQSRQNIAEHEALNWLIHRAEIKPPLEPGQRPELSDEISDEVKLALRPIVLEIYQTLQALHSQKSWDVTHLYVTGGITRLRGLTDFLSRELRLQVFEWSAFTGFHTDLVVASDDSARRFALAIALAHRFALKKPVGWLNFRRSPQAQRRVLTNFFETLSSPSVRPVLQGIAVTFMLILSYSFLSSVLSSERGMSVQKELAGEFRRMNPDLGRRAAQLAQDPARAREVYTQERKKILAADPADEVITRVRPRSEVLLEVSDSVPANGVLKRVALETRGPELEVRYVVEFVSAPGDTLARARSSIEQALNARAYKNIKVTELSSRRGLETVARLAPEEVPYE